MSSPQKVEKARRVLDSEIQALDEQVKLARRRTKSLGGDQERSDSSTQSTITESSIQSEQQRAIEILTIRQEQLQQISSWIANDKDLLPSIRKIFEEDETGRARRALLLNILLSTIFLLAGWGLSIIAPPSSFR
jgi:hypothetical protein